MTVIRRACTFAVSLVVLSFVAKFLLFSSTLSFEKAFFSIFGSLAPYLNGQMLSVPYTSGTGSLEQIVTAILLILIAPAMLIIAVLRFNTRLLPLWALIWYVLGLVFVSVGI